MKFELSKDIKGEWRWSLIANNGKIIAVAGEGYKNRCDCLHAIGLVQDCCNVPIGCGTEPTEQAAD